MKRFALLGHDIGYSLSPTIHGMVYEHYGLDATYTLMDVPKEKLGAAIETLKREYDGFNITKPYKVDILPYLDDRNGYDSVNTVVNRDGRSIGYSTDGDGFVRHFTEFFDAKGKNVLVLGAGGVARIIVPALIDLGGRVFVYNRTPERAKALCERTGATVWTGEKPSYIVNCTSCGLHAGENPLPPETDLSALTGVYDTIYAPPQTDLLKQCASCGATAVNGLGMLVWQALKACEYLCGVKRDDTLYRKIMYRLEERSKQA